jgi:hypothetical protein
MPTVSTVDLVPDFALESTEFLGGGHTVLQAHVSLTARNHHHEDRPLRQPPTANRASLAVKHS